MHIKDINALYEAYEGKIEDEKIEIPLNTIIDEAIKYLKDETGATLSFKDIRDNYLVFSLSGEDNNKTVLKDRLGINSDEEGLQSNNAITNVKKSIIQILQDNFEGFDINSVRIDSINDNYGDIIFIDMKFKLPNVPKDITATVKLFDDGHIEIGVSYYGNSREETYRKNSYNNDMFVDILKTIQNIYI